jgi:hypothetical protein
MQMRFVELTMAPNIRWVKWTWLRSLITPRVPLKGPIGLLQRWPGSLDQPIAIWKVVVRINLRAWLTSSMDKRQPPQWDSNLQPTRWMINISNSQEVPLEEEPFQRQMALKLLKVWVWPLMAIFSKEWWMKITKITKIWICLKRVKEDRTCLLITFKRVLISYRISIKAIIIGHLETKTLCMWQMESVESRTSSNKPKLCILTTQTCI